MSLVTLSEIKTFLGITDNSKDDILTLFQESVEASIINYCETNFTSKVVTGEISDGTQADVIVLQNYPVLSVQKVYLEGAEISTDLYYNDENSIMFKAGSTFFKRGSVSVNYTHGYASVPKDVKMAVYQTVKAEMQRYEQNTENINSRSKEGESESFGGAWDSLSGLPKQIISKIAHYRPLEFPLVNMAQRNY